MARRRQIRQLRAVEVPDAVVLDAEGLSAGAQGNLRVRAELTVAEGLGARVYVSSVTLAEVLRGKPRDARVLENSSGGPAEMTPSMQLLRSRPGASGNTFAW
jgi:hypothetical protein